MKRTLRKVTYEGNTGYSEGEEPFSPEGLRREFPVLRQKAHGKSLVYLDNAASTQKPEEVIESLTRFYRNDYANIHRGVYELSQRATRLYEEARRKVQHFINAKQEEEVIFLRGATEALNLVASSLGQFVLKPGDEILVSQLAHHSNLVPWQLIAQRVGARLKPIPVDDRGDLDLDNLQVLLGSGNVKIVAVGHVSNALGTINPVKKIAQMAHEVGAYVVIDGAQATPHLKVDVQAIDCDFYAISAHKMYGPCGVGALYGKRDLLEKLPPYQGGGDMITSVTFERTIYNHVPFRFEAGTPNIAGAIGMGAAVDFLERVGVERIQTYENDLLNYATTALSAIPGLRIIGTAKEKAAVISFVIDNIHPHDLGSLLDEEGMAIRAGHHCAQPAMDRFKIPATVRISFALYNTKEEIDAFVEALQRVREVFR